MDISNHHIENETIEPNKDLDRKIYVKIIILIIIKLIKRIY